MVQRYAAAPPVYLREDEIAAVLRAKQIIKEDLGGVPTISELCKRVALNKNKLQLAFRLTEGKVSASIYAPCEWSEALS